MKDVVYSIQLRPKLFTLAQARTSTLIEFFDVRTEDGTWMRVDLGAVTPLFCVHVASAFVKKYGAGKSSAKQVRPNTRPIPKRMLSYDFGKPGQADLVELNERHEALVANGAKVVEVGLSAKDRETVLAYESCGSFGARHIYDRLTTYFDTGINFDRTKLAWFKDLVPPSGMPVASAAARPPKKNDAEHRSSAMRPRVAKKLRGVLAALAEDLRALPPRSTKATKEKLFEAAVRNINDWANDIETEEREATLAKLYALGESVGLDSRAKYLERWRGDW